MPRSSASFDDTDATLVLREDGVIDHVSAGAHRLLDLGSRSLTGHNFFRRIPSDAVARVARTLLDLSARKDGHVTGLLQLKTGLGPWQWFKVEMTPRRRYEDEAGVILRLRARGCG
jgi:PAS domain-containing protein